MSLSLQPSAPNFAVDQGLEYYAGKSELLDWVNRLLDLNLVRLEQLTSGAVYCQVLDAFYADAVAIRKVNFLAREEYEILPNYKVLQAAFNALGFTKELNVPKLSHASTSDLMEFAQWLYKSFKGVATLPGYNPAARRALSKFPSNSIPFPACCMNGNFDFGRSDLRVSGLWTVTTPQETVKTLPRTQRPGSGTPASSAKPGTAEKGSGGGSTAKRSMPNLNVASRYREGLAVPPEHYQRTSPLLSPSSPGPKLPPVPTREGGTQTDFADEEYRPMTAEDVGTEAAPPKPSRRDHGEQYEDGFGYGSSRRGGGNADSGGLSPSGSVLSQVSGLNGQPGSHAEDAFTFGQVGPSGKIGLPFGSGAVEPPLVNAQSVTDADAAALGSDWRRGSNTAADAGTQYSLTRDAAAGLDGNTEQADTSNTTIGGAGATQSPYRGVGTQANGFADAATDTALGEEENFDGFTTPMADRSAGGAMNAEGGRADQDAGLATVFGAQHAALAAGPVASGGAGAPESGLASPTPGGRSPRTGSVAGAATPSTPAALVAALRRSAAGALPADVASLLASPGPRHRVASAASQRNMGTALDVSADALAAVQKALDSYTALLDRTAASDNGDATVAPAVHDAQVAGDDAGGTRATAAAGAAGSEVAGSASGGSATLPWPCSAALCGKARSLQDALQTVLAHTTLLLADVQAYSEATQPPGTPSSRLTSPRLTSPRSVSPRAVSPRLSRGGVVAAAASPSVAGGEAGSAAASPATAEPGTGMGGQRNCVTEAASLLEVARSHDSRLQALIQQANQALKLPSAEPEPSDRNSPNGHTASTPAASTTPTSVPATAGSVTASAAAVSASTSQYHLTTEQRKLCSTSQLDAHLKAVGVAQFALVQGIHRELIEQTSSYFRHPGGAADAPAGGDGGAAAGSSSGASRKARAFKLGEYQLKQLRNGDVYKGRYISNKKNGEGVYHFINADVYEGEFRDDRMDGHGVYTFSHEGRYEGQWRNAVYNGTGAETFAKGSTYRGEYASGLRNGWGVCRFYNGDYYEGQWAKGQRDGSGMQQCTDDSNFVGDYQRGKRHGHGVYSFPNGDRYEGQYCEDLPHGHGTYYFASGQCYQGQWQQGKKHGWSVYTVDNGSRFMGLWSQGKPTWVQPLNGDAAASASVSDEEERSLQQALEARDQAVKAAAEARQRAASHWDAAGPIQANVQSALSRAHASRALAQAARRKACELAAKLDAAVALLQLQGGTASPSALTPPAGLAAPATGSTAPASGPMAPAAGSTAPAAGSTATAPGTLP